MAQFGKNQQVMLAIILAFAIIAQQARALDPIVDTGVSPLSPDGRHVAVHLPGILSLVIDTRGPLKGAKIEQSVMLGLVRVNIDRARDAKGVMQGPIKVSVAGMTVYDNKAAPIAS